MDKTLEEYKQQVLNAMLAMTDDNGEALLTERQARQILKDLGDAPLADGMLFNTAEETAQFIMET